MGLTATQLAKRSESLGASDIAALFGVSPFRTSYDLWLEKTGKLLPEPESDNDPRMAGQLLEPAVLTFAENRLGKLRRNQSRSARQSKGLPIVANLDAILVETGEPVEAKTSGLYGSTKDFWGEPETDAIPDYILVQAMTQMLVTDANVCHVPAFIAFRGFLMYRINRDEEVINEIGERALDFWLNHVLTDEPPTDSQPNIAVIKRLRREPNKIVTLDHSLIEKWEDWKGAESIARKEKDVALAAILTALGDAEAGETPEGRFTYLEQTRKSYTVEESTYRVARFKKAK